MTRHAFSSENQPEKRKGRGPSPRTLILEAMKRAGKTEEGFYDLLFERALDSEDKFALPELLKRLAPIPKATMPMVEFEFDKESTPVQQASQVIDAIAAGHIPADIGKMFVDSLTNMLKISEVTDLEERIKALENDQA